MTNQHDIDDSAESDSSVGHSADKTTDGDNNGTKRARRLPGCLLKIGLLIGAIMIAGFLLNRYSRPEFDPDSIRSVTVTQAENDGTANGLPENAITRGYTQATFDNADHPLEPMMEIAKAGLAHIEATIDDYTYTMVKQTRYNEKLNDETHIFCKIRHEKNIGGDDEIPFSVYTRFVAPQKKLGQEGIWIKGRNDGKLIAHPPSGWTNRIRLTLEPTGMIAMSGELHPITEIGLKNLVRTLIKTGTGDLKHQECNVQIQRDVEINGVKCTLLQVTHPKRREHFEFHIAKIYIDDQRNIPIAYEGFVWPKKEGDPPVLQEKYYFTDIKINVGLKDIDFDPSNPDYDYP